MNALFALFAAFATFLAPITMLVQHDVSVETPIANAAVDQTFVSEARLVFDVHHTGIEAPALLTLEGDSVSWVHAVTLKPGRQTLIDATFPIGTYSITLQNVVTAGTNHVDLTACPDGMTVALMVTAFDLTRFAMGVAEDACVPSQA